MGSSEKFCLRWNDFESNISGAFRELREDKDFFDVTLACDDDQLQAHKVILSACSPFFRSILRRNRHEHPLLYLKGVKYADLVSVLDFMYHGEVNIAQEELNSFLAVAEDLQVKGLSQKSYNRNIETPTQNISGKHSSTQPHPAPTAHKRPQARPNPPKKVTTCPPNPFRVENDDMQEIVPIKSEPLPLATDIQAPTYNAMVEQAYTDNTQQYQEGIITASNMEYDEEYTDYGYGGYDNSMAGDQDENKALDELIAKSMSLIVDESGARIWNCDLCNRNNKSKQDIRRHMEIHLQVQHQCPHCEKQVQTREALRKHIYRYHKY